MVFIMKQFGWYFVSEIRIEREKERGWQGFFTGNICLFNLFCFFVFPKENKQASPVIVCKHCLGMINMELLSLLLLFSSFSYKTTRTQ